MMATLAATEVVDKHTVKFTLKEPDAFFLDFLANPMALCIVAREAVDKFTDLKKPEAVIGTGPWMLEGHEPKVRTTFVRNPDYFIKGLPYIQRIEGIDFNDPAARLAAFVTGQIDAGPEFPGMMIRRQDWKIIKEQRPKLRYVEFPSNVMNHAGMRTDKPPFGDIRVRRALSMAIDRKAVLQATAEGVGVMNPPIPAGLLSLAIPYDQLGEGLKWDAVQPGRGQEAPGRGRPPERLQHQPRIRDLRLAGDHRRRSRWRSSSGRTSGWTSRWSRSPTRPTSPPPTRESRTP